LMVGYREFMDTQIKSSVAKAMPVIGVSYARPGYFSPEMGYRIDFAYGQAEQNLYVDPLTLPAKVSQTSLAGALLYRKSSGGLALYGGPQLGLLYLTRDVDFASASRETDVTPTLGGVAGMHFHYKQHFSMAFEASLNYANIELSNTSTDALYYSVFGSLSYNF